MRDTYQPTCYDNNPKNSKVMIYEKKCEGITEKQWSVHRLKRFWDQNDFQSRLIAIKVKEKDVPKNNVSIELDKNRSRTYIKATEADRTGRKRKKKKNFNCEYYFFFFFCHVYLLSCSLYEDLTPIN
jgi:hypothetical protein